MNIYRKLTMLLLSIIPLILIACIWMWIGPVGFWQMIIMVIVSIILYVIFLIAELILVALLVKG